MDELIECIKAIPAVGIMIQMPFYDEEAKNQKLLEAIPNYADVDGLTKDALVIPATAKGVFEYLIANDLINGKKIVIIGRSKLVGLPLAKLLTGLNCTVTMCHSKTPDIKEYTKVADVVVCAVGKRNFLDNSFINDNTPMSLMLALTLMKMVNSVVIVMLRLLTELLFLMVLAYSQLLTSMIT